MLGGLKNRRKHQFSRNVFLLSFAIVAVALWFLVGQNLSSNSSQEELDAEFDDYIISRESLKASTSPPKTNVAPLEIFGFNEKLPSSEVWKTLKSGLNSNLSVGDSLLSAVVFDVNHKVNFANLEPLANHIDQIAKEHQRFLSASFVRLQKLVGRFPNIHERQLVEKKLNSVAFYSREFNRALRKEVKDFLFRTGLNSKTRDALYKLKLKVQLAIEQKQKYPCTQAVKCVLTNRSGFSSGIHDVLWCMIKGFQDNKRVVLDASGWHYLGKHMKWNEVFKEIDDVANTNCSHLDDSGLLGTLDDRKAIHNLPVDIAEPLIRYHQDPYAWWFGQFIGHIMRPSELTEELIRQAKQTLGFKSPIVGLHIRRTDKVTEAAYREVEDYMEHVAEYYASLDADVPKRVYVATDEPKVLDELRASFPAYVFISNSESAKLANEIDSRDKPESFQGLIIDMYLLAQTDKLICTLSSGLCRVVYELMQYRRTDATDHVVTLDVPYFFAYVAQPPRQAVYPHRSLEENGMNFDIEDCIDKISDVSVIGESQRKDRYDGFSQGIICHSSLLAGSYPNFKTIPTVRINGSRISLF